MAPATLECRTVAGEIWAYMDGELSTERADAMRVHFDGCAGCTAQLEYRQVFMDAIHESISSQKTPPALREKVLTALFAAA
jgi:mycothiol system anti-sigma-R factor